jgi:hypothetical protein
MEYWNVGVMGFRIQETKSIILMKEFRAGDPSRTAGGRRASGNKQQEGTE